MSYLDYARAETGVKEIFWYFSGALPDLVRKGTGNLAVTRPEKTVAAVRVKGCDYYDYDEI